MPMFRVAVAAVMAAWLGGCSTVMRPAEATIAPPAVPAVAEAEASAVADATAPAHALVVGVVSFGEPDNLSGGVADAPEKAALLAANRMSNGSVQVLVEPQSNARNAAVSGKRLADAQARVVVGGSDMAAVSAMADALGNPSIPTITLAPGSDTRLSIYSAALAGRDEAHALLTEAKRLGLGRLVVVSTAAQDSARLAAALAALAPEFSIVTQQVDGNDMSGLQASLQAAAADTVKAALVFAIAPQAAANIVANLAGEATADVSVIGNAGWILAEPLPAALRGGWFPSLSPQSVRKFADQFKKAYQQTPTLASAVLYDLVIMAVALDRTAKTEAFTSATLQSPLGFTGFTGNFTFGAVGLIKPRQYEIVRIP